MHLKMHSLLTFREMKHYISFCVEIQPSVVRLKRGSLEQIIMVNNTTYIREFQSLVN